MVLSLPWRAQCPRVVYMSAPSDQRGAGSHSGLLGQSVLSIGFPSSARVCQPRRRLEKRGVGAKSRGTLRTAPGIDPTTSVSARALIVTCQASLGLIREGAVISLASSYGPSLSFTLGSYSFEKNGSRVLADSSSSLV